MSLKERKAFFLAVPGAVFANHKPKVIDRAHLIP